MSDYFDRCRRTNGSWYNNTADRPERVVIPLSALPTIVHYAVETEPAFYSPSTYYTSVPAYVNTVPAVESSGLVTTQVSTPQSRQTLGGLISQNQLPIDQILNSTRYQQ